MFRLHLILKKCSDFDVEHTALFTAFRIIPINSTILCKEVKSKKLNIPQTTKYVTLTEEQMLKLFENRDIRKVFGPKRYELRGDRKILYKMELLYLKPLPNIN
jgi:hypothetical protein